ncbi:cadmium-translocating P-type ATPase [Formosa sediminum]|uniref:P-type Zn(2+) transporter n=1 Tax=Formosa sediminum TaxID=2594004 RepID=A0A516GTK5_9FLAO|nr:heavy metal translocating P-type ATPase [Formosa sediminum]QDO94720.1 cadmium-translocating P-type ATPase [Formosa sediminum]
MSNIHTEPNQDQGHCCGNAHCQTQETATSNPYRPALLSFILLLIGLTLDYFKVSFFTSVVRILWFTAAYIPVGFPVLKASWQSIKAGAFFTEFFLMTIATLGAFALGEYPEAVTVMLFYAIGELFQDAAVTKARGNIKALLDVRPKEANVFRAGNYISVAPEQVVIGETIQVKVGEKVPLDGLLISAKAALNTAALTGESKPSRTYKGEEVFAGSINLEGVIEVKVTRAFKDSSISRILELVQNATARKSKTELFIRKFAKIYTPIVVYLAIGITVLPYFFVSDYVFGDWLYRALIFLVISCPCALVISIPLGYFGGLGAASKHGILFKGASFLDTISKVKTVVLDKTGTLTQGVFKIKTIKTFGIDELKFMKYLQAIESQSTHPIAKAIMKYPTNDYFKATHVKELAGKGLSGVVDSKTILVGNATLMATYNIEIPEACKEIIESVVYVALADKFMGYVIIADELKQDAKQAIEKLQQLGVRDVIMLSGDKDSITKQVARDLNIKIAKGELLPEDKLHEVAQLQQHSTHKVAFVGDGINDAPVLATSDVGIAMGGLGSDVAIETADVVIQTDQPSKISQAIQIGRATRAIVWQNIILAFGIKLVVLILGASGLATMWEAVFADVGVALLAILNAVRLQRMTWD